MMTDDQIKFRNIMFDIQATEKIIMNAINRRDIAIACLNREVTKLHKLQNLVRDIERGLQ